MLKSEAIRLFLNANTHTDLAALYNPAMEVQVNCIKSNERVEFSKGFGYTDGEQTWSNIRMPAKAMSEPEDNDGPIRFEFDKYVEGIGMTGWNYKERVSKYVVYDFDALLGHSDNHAKKLTDRELIEVQEVITKLPYATIRKSTSGRGLHVYVFVDNVPTANHTEHAALARSILSMMCGNTGYDFSQKVDVCGSNIWVWHRKMIGTPGLTLLKKGEVLTNVPANWRDHLNVITSKTSRITANPYMIEEKVTDDVFQQLSGQRAKIKLDTTHRDLIKYLQDNKLMSWWDSDNHMLVTHTAYLAQAFEHFKYKGEFHTLATGKDYGHDINCFLYPLRNGAWTVRRYGQGTQEHKLWKPDKWTRCYYNRDLTLSDVARLFDAVELENGGFKFNDVETATNALLKLGVTLTTPQWIKTRLNCIIKDLRTDYKFSIVIPKEETDDASSMKDWSIDRRSYKKVIQNPRTGIVDEIIALTDFDDAVRHIISEHGEDMGWVISTNENQWRNEPLNHVRVLLKSKGIGPKDVDLILGKCVSQPWTIVNKPFEPEYPGDREWNRSKAKFKIAPTVEGDNISHPTWDKILTHCGESLDQTILENSWCIANDIKSGAHYLKLWLACLIRYPKQPLPYLAFWGPQDSGKSTFHEAFCQIILDGGYVRADNALISSSGFNGELKDSIMAIVEEVNVSEKTSYNRIKDWVTSSQINIHEKGHTPYISPNYNHWIQCSNHKSYIPIFQGDTRVTLSYVDSLKKVDMIPKRDLMQILVKEAPDFLASLLSIYIPDSRDRLMLPVINSGDKLVAQDEQMDSVESFFVEHIVPVDGAYVSCEDLYSYFLTKVSAEENTKYTYKSFCAKIPEFYLKGRISESRTQNNYIGNICIKGQEIPASAQWVRSGNKFLRRKV